MTHLAIRPIAFVSLRLLALSRDKILISFYKSLRAICPTDILPCVQILGIPTLEPVILLFEIYSLGNAIP